MSKELDLFLDNHVEVYGNKLDERINFKEDAGIKGTLIEAVDGPFSKFLMKNVGNRFLAPLIPDPVKVEAHEFMDTHIAAIEDGTLTETEKEEIAKQFADIPETIALRANLSEANKKMLVGVFNLIDGAIEVGIK